MTDQTTKEVTLLFLIRSGQVLLAMKKRRFGAGKWNGVGGKVDPGETIIQALIRECQEEIGVTPVNYWQVADITFDEIHLEERKYMHTSVYLCDKWEGNPTESEEMAPQWFDVSSIPYDQMWPDDPLWLPQVLAGEKVKAIFTFTDDNTITGHTVTTVDQL